MARVQDLGHVRRRVVHDLHPTGAGVVLPEPLGQVDDRLDARKEPVVGESHVYIDALAGDLGHHIGKPRTRQGLGDQGNM
jgi:hypothetical protein